MLQMQFPPFSVDVSRCLKTEVNGQSGCIYTRRGSIVAQNVITLDPERHLYHNRILSQYMYSVSVHD